MTTPVDIVNQALLAIGARGQVSSISPSDGSPAANAASQIYTTTIQALLRAAHWNCARYQATLTLLYSLYDANGNLSANPPQQPWSYEYELPSDCLKLRAIPIALSTSSDGFSMPGANISGLSNRWLGFAPFQVGLGDDTSGTKLKVVLTSVAGAIGIYTADISALPDLWDALFRQAAISALGAYLCPALTGSEARLAAQVKIAQGNILSARLTDGNEGLSSQDEIPDWIRARWTGGIPSARDSIYAVASWDQMAFPGGVAV